MSDYSMNHGQQQWGAPAFPETHHIQLEEYYMNNPSQTNGHVQHHAPHHTSSYPPAGNQIPNRLSHNGPGPRSHSYNAHPTYSFNAGTAYTPSMGQANLNTTQQTMTEGGFLAQPSYRPPYPQVVTSLHGSPSFNNNLTPSEPATSPPSFTVSPMSTPHIFGSQPLPSHAQAQYRQQQSHMHHDASASVHESEQGRQVKRLRIPEEDDDLEPMNMVEDEDSKDGKDSKSKLGGGACQRCKGLKVKCEFPSAEDACRRCMNAGKPCWIPGRKKRRTPPKREHLLQQIREQTVHIEKLMAQLEATKKQTQSTSAHRGSPSADMLSPLDPSSPSSATSKPDVEEWIAKARESIEAFGGLIGAGGAGATQGFLQDQDPDDSWNESDDNSSPVEGEDRASVDPDERGDDERPGHVRSPSTGQESVASGSKSSAATWTQKPVMLPHGSSPFGLMANLSLKHGKRQPSPGIAEEEDVGVASDQYFKPERTPDPETIRTPTDVKPAPPHILARGVITPDEAEKLFRIYFDNMNLSCSLLDPYLYTAQKTCYRSPFLFTVICAIASRFYVERPDLYHDLMHYAQLAAGTALIGGHKSVEVCQAYILLSLYPVPARKWEDHRTWLYLGLAIRVASDLNLHLPNTAKPQNEGHAREMLNRTRVWLNCFNLDRSTGSQYGKAPIIPNSDYVANHSEKWWKSSEYNLKNFDMQVKITPNPNFPTRLIEFLQLCGYNAELKVMARFTAKVYNDPNHPTGLNKGKGSRQTDLCTQNVNFEKIAFETDEELKTLGSHWFALLDQTDQTDTQNRFRTGLLRIAYSYARLVALSLAFQHAFGKQGSNDKALVKRCLAAASDIANIYVNDVGRPAQRIYIRHGPEAQCVFVTFAASFLVKLLHKKYSTYLSSEKRLEIRSLVQSVAELLGSPEIAIDDHHSPKLYSRFLMGLLATPMAHVDSGVSSGSSNSSQSRLAGKGTSRTCHTPDSDHSFEIVPSSPATSAANSARESSPTIHYVAATPPSFSPYNSSPANATRDLNMDDFFPQPLAFEAELTQSMQSVQNSLWGGDMALTGKLLIHPANRPVH
ncbi:hypothetical protein HWV62_43471 [Athelia sp. TMB]|nr:hypothetical protein HWV62_43471 [Athelia sp. TMB]